VYYPTLIFATMKPFLFLILAIFFYSCKTKEQREAEPENDIDAARNFIRAALDGRYDLAKTFLLSDSTNASYLDNARRIYERLSNETRNNYRTSSINIHHVFELVKDSLTIVEFSNSFKNDHDSLKVVRQNGKWLIDLKYLYEHEMDTIVQKMITSDTLSK
jgi:hypothetical protein